MRAKHLPAGRARRILACSASAAALLVAGCTVTPKPLTDVERGAEAQADLKAMFAGQEPLTHPLTLQEAYARALKYNLDRRVKLMEEAVAYDGLTVDSFDMLPKLTAEAGYLSRNNTLAESSRSITTGATTVPPSTSSDNNHVTADLTMSWNLLDFGVSYFAARQDADRVLIAQERRRKVAQNLIEQVRGAFWRAASAQALGAKIDASIKAAETALDTSRKVEVQGLSSPLDALRYQRTLLDLLRQLDEVRDKLNIAKTELASLIDLPPGETLTLVVPPQADMTYQPISEPIRDMEQVALLRNPDLRELSYQARISVDEVHKSILRLLPGLSFNYGGQFDSNSFLTHNYWGQGAAQVSWNLLYVLQAPRVIRQADDQVKLAEAQRQAVAMAVLTKLYLAYQQYLDAGKEYKRVRELADVDDRIYDQIANRVDVNAQNALERIAAEVSAVSSDLREYEGYADLQAALGRIYDTLGVDAEAKNLAELDVATLARETNAIMATWQQGPGPAPGKPKPDTTHMPPLPASATEDHGLIGGIERALRDVFGP